MNQEQEDERNLRLKEELEIARRRVDKLEASNKALAAERDRYASQYLAAREHADSVQEALDELTAEEITQVSARTYELTEAGKRALAEQQETVLQVEADASLAMQERAHRAERLLLDAENAICAALGHWVGPWIAAAVERIEAANDARMNTGVRAVERALQMAPDGPGDVGADALSG